MSISEDYNQWANIYDSNINKTRDLDAFATKEVLQNLEFNSVLELGCGTGKNTAFLRKKNASITGLDFSQEMLNIARKKFHNSTVNFILTDLNKKWPVADNSFDLVTCSLTLEHINNLESFFRKAAKSLKNNGIFFISELHPHKQYLGSKARFEDNGKTTFLEVYTHHLSDYLEAAENTGFKLKKIQEWFDEPGAPMPRLISFVFEK